MTMFDADFYKVTRWGPFGLFRRVTRRHSTVPYEELAILRGQQVTVTFKNPKDAFDLFNELRDRGANGRTDK